MKISKELIEKYHRGECSQEEQAFVEEWLFDDSFTDELMLPPTEDKETHKEKIWEGLAPALPESNKKKNRVAPFWPYRVQLTAAACILALAFSWFYRPGQTPDTESEVIVANNLSEVDSRDINSDFYSLSLGPKSNVRIDQQQEVMQLCGSLSFVPTENVTLKIVGECPKGESPETVVNLKRGANYIAFSYQDLAEKTELIVVEEDQLNTLPVFIQKQLFTLFKI